MEFALTINNLDFHPWVAEDGIQLATVQRQGRDVVVLNGTLYSSSIDKLEISVSLVELRDNTLTLLRTALTNPSTVSITMDGQTISRVFYIRDYSAGVKTVRGGNTYYSGVGFKLEER